MHPEEILPTYRRVAEKFAHERDKSLFERRWLDRLLAHAPGRRVLDLGCGPGVPMAAYLSDRRAALTGIDGAPEMVALYRRNLPEAEALCRDMRGLDLETRFDAILAWNSFFHLAPEDQRAMFPVFAAHAKPGAALMFTSGPAAGEVWGTAGGETVYHSSLDPEEYRALLAKAGFTVLRYVAEDAGCRGHTVWLARFRPSA